MDMRNPDRKSVDLKPLTTEELQSVVSWEVGRSVDWIESNISDIRQKCETYYMGGTAQVSERGRAQVTISTVRDTIHAILPSIGRIFTQTDVVGEFSSDDEEDEQMTQDETLFCNGIFNKFGGYKAMIQATTDAMKSRIGVVKVDLERVKVASHQKSEMMDDEELEELQEEVQLGNIIITEISDPMDQEMPGMAPPGMEGAESEMPDLLSMMAPQPPPPPMLRQVTMTRHVMRNKWTLSPLAPEDFIVDSSATEIENARLVGVRRNMAIYEAMSSLGLLYDDLKDQSSDDTSALENEKFNRLRYDTSDWDSNTSVDPTAKTVLITELWMRIDADGDEVAELRHFICAGVNYEILVDEVVHFVPLAVFMTDLQPHVFFPISLTEDMIQDQDVMTSITRSIVDNVAFVNSPRTAINETQVNLEDAKNTEIGAMIRVKSMGQIEELATPFVAGQTLPILQYLHENSEQRSGVTKLSQGLDPNALQSTSRIASNAMVTGSDARIEMMARNIAETGMKELFVAILRTAMYHLKGKQSIRTPSGYKFINPALWHDQINVNINVGLGNGRIEEKQVTLQGMAGVQQEIVKMMGMNNPLCGWTNLRNTYKTILRLSGIKNVGDYFPFVPDEQLKAFEQQMEQKNAEAAKSQQPSAPDLVGAAKVKAESDIQVNQAKIMAQQQADIMKMQKEQQELIATMQQKHELDMTAMRADMQTKLTIAGWSDDQKRDAANQKFAVDSKKVELDNETKRQVARENASNQVTQ